MKVIHLSATDLQGGAGRAAYRLHAGLVQSGVDSTMIVRRKSSDDASVRVYDPVSASYGPSGTFGFKVNRMTWNLRRLSHPRAIASDIELMKLLRSRPGGHDLFSDCSVPIVRSLPSFLPDSQILNMHWVTGMIDYPSFFPQVLPTRPIVWTLHDMNALTGGCHYDEGCGRFMDACGACPQLHSSSDTDPSRRIFNQKSETFSRIDRERMEIVTPSKWLWDTARNSPLLGDFSINLIPTALDIDVFQPRPKRLAREVLGIEPDAQVALIVADSLANRRKGMEYLIPSIAKLNDLHHLTLLSVGRDLDPAVRSQINLDEQHVAHVGIVTNDRLLSLIYSAADVFVLPSKQDNLPNTMLESIACGVPVVGFDIGGIADLARPGATGELVPYADAEGLSSAMRKILTDEDYRNHLATSCREVATKELGLSVQAGRYMELYESMLERTSSSGADARGH